ncbi:formimidoylglutamate deiminase [Sulfitobacter sp. F26204]|uniref:formimidoylglutamate deiminase n=1 Tax=Sulfitobacter sp. F26204 TaxID=2996014 RepID=UPI00225DDDC5|nr:formimidoylglutamate deiminase [Sulfitobacter sp. F26204]MCX7560253.1 formimidoylglutamate deiminase [Sulfitobacter sp. F26204]
MKTVWAKTALLPTGWASRVRIDIDDAGRIASVRPNAPEAGTRAGLLLPAPVNVHSHAFQRAMAGLTERRGPNPNDSFWTWRQLMFRFLDRLTPDHVEAIAAFVQMEMLEAGYATNTEFHYLHHQPGGVPYENLAEMSERIAAAAQKTGIGICLLPVHYEFGGCDGRGLTAGQIRFENTLDRFHELHTGAVKALSPLPQDSSYGVAPHSLRAVGEQNLKSYGDLFPTGPIHMHLAEQIPEVEEVMKHRGARPVTWALENMNIGDRWCLIHCTQMTPHETLQLARSGAVAGLCPITESSLGDGIFDAVRWMDAEGATAIGSDSNIRIALAEELRTLEYSQRLRDGTRAALATYEFSTGRRMFDAILKGGAQATGRKTGRLETGYWGDMLTLDTTSEHLSGRTEDTALDAWIFAGDDRLVTNVWSAGRHMVKDGRHSARAEIVANYLRTLDALQDAL